MSDKVSADPDPEAPMPTDAPDLSTLDFWSLPPDEREAGFRALRDEEPVSWHRQPEGGLVPPEDATGGFWAVTRHEDIRTVSRDAERFVSGRGVMLEDVPQLFLDMSQSFLILDGDEHRALRSLVSAGFTPRQVRHQEEGVRRDVATILDDLDDHPDGDFVEHVAKRLPLMTIMRLLGVPEEERDEIVHHADSAVSWNDPEYLAGREPLEVIGNAMVELTTACNRYIEERRARPGDDLLSALTLAEVDGERLTDEQISSFFVLLSVAGNDTTRHTTSHVLHGLMSHPDERAALVADPAGLMDTALDEFVRWASPVMTFRRTATVDTVLAGREIAAGDKLVLLYPSGNRDERAFEDPQRMDLRRTPNRHLGFGGGGPHYCMGAALAKLQLRELFTGLFTRYPDLEVGDPTYVVGNFVNGITRMPMDRGRRAA